MDERSLLLGLLFGSIGMGFAIYGRRQRQLMPFLAGLGLIGLPYVVDSTMAMIAVAILLVVLPFVVRR